MKTTRVPATRCALLLLVLAVLLPACGAPAQDESAGGAAAPAGTGGLATDDQATEGQATDGQAAGATDIACEDQSLAVAQVQPTFNNLPFYIAESAGYFNGLQLDVTELGAGSEVTAAMVSGSVEVALGPLSSIYNARQGGAPVVAIATISDYFPAVVAIDSAVLEEKGISADAPVNERAEALLGIDVGITTPGGGTDQMTRTILTEAGFDADTDTTVIPIGSMSAMVPAFESGQLQAIVSTHPDADRAVARHGDAEWLFPIGSHPALQDMAAITVFTAESVIEENEAALTCFVAGIERALRLIQEQPEEAAELVWPAFEPGFEEFGRPLFDEAFANAAAQYAEHVELIEAQAEKAREFANTYAERPIEVAPSDVIDNSIAEPAMEIVGDESS